MKNVLVWVMALVLVCVMTVVGFYCGRVVAERKTNDDTFAKVIEEYDYCDYVDMAIVYTQHEIDFRHYDDASLREYIYMDYGKPIFTGYKCVGYDDYNNIVYEFLVSIDELVDFSETPLYRITAEELGI